MVFEVFAAEDELPVTCFEDEEELELCFEEDEELPDVDVELVAFVA